VGEVGVLEGGELVIPNSIERVKFYH
jgi:hypothetical protein